MNIIDKLDKKISDKKNKKRLKEEEERLEYEKTQKLFKPIAILVQMFIKKTWLMIL